MQGAVSDESEPIWRLAKPIISDLRIQFELTE